MRDNPSFGSSEWHRQQQEQSGNALGAALLLILVFGIFILAFRLARWLLTRAGGLGLLGLATVIGGIWLGASLAPSDGETGAEPSTALVLVIWAVILSGVIVWIVGAVRKPAD